MKHAAQDNLARDTMQAVALGYPSYGYYKVDYPHTKAVEDEPTVATNMAVCKECGKVFCPTRKGMVYCSKGCSARLIQRERYRKKIAQKKAQTT